MDFPTQAAAAHEAQMMSLWFLGNTFSVYAKTVINGVRQSCGSLAPADFRFNNGRLTYAADHVAFA